MIPLASQPRPADQVAAGYLNLVIAGTARQVPVLPIAANREWTTIARQAVETAVGGVGAVETLADVVAQLEGGIDLMLDLLVAYDRSGVLGGREFMEQHAAPQEVYAAIRQVTVAAFPTGPDLARLAPELRTILMQALLEAASSKSTNRSRPSTGGRPRGSKRS